jgi:carbamoyltransferase
MNKNKLNSDYICINGGHNTSITFVDKNDQIRIFEFERFCKKRYAGIWELSKRDDKSEERKKVITEFLEYTKTQIKEYPKVIGFSELNPVVLEFVLSVFPGCQFYQMGHHMSHCAGAYYQSGFKRALAISIDGGGLDYDNETSTFIRSYSIFKYEGDECEVISHTNDGKSEICNPGIYGAFAYYVSEIKKDLNDDGIPEKNSLAYAGKIMGLAAYGKVRLEWITPIRNFYMNHPTKHWNSFNMEENDIENKLFKDIGIQLTQDHFSGQDSYDLAATNQYVFEELCFSLIKKYIDVYNIDVVFSGGSALNVLFNQKLAEYLERKSLKLYIPSHPGDEGLSFGHYVSLQHEYIDPSPYCGIDIMDRDKLSYYYEKYDKQDKVKERSVKLIVDLIKDGKIGGIIQGYSEVGPRALGNRSIICDPSIRDMKDILNSKVKFREWFRPFAPVCREEDRDLYFVKSYPSEYMSFAPEVKEEYRDVLPAITHQDGTARLQTVTSCQHQLFYDILTELSDRGNIAVIMNTSFNIRGNPILTTYEDAFHVLENTELDFIVTEDYLFIK